MTKMTMLEYEELLMRVFALGLENFGLDTTIRMFSNYVLEPTKAEQGNAEKIELLKLLDDMKPKPNIKRLARELMAENPGKYQSASALEQHIRRIVKDRPALEAKFSDVSPPRGGRGQPIGFRLIRRPRKN